MLNSLIPHRWQRPSNHKKFKFTWLPVWRRNLNVWRKLLLVSIVGNFFDPLIYLLALGYGVGHFIGTIEGIAYLTYLATGVVCSSAMFSASFESLYSAYTRMAHQKTWEAMLSTPLCLSDILKGELFWAASKGLLSSIAILIIAVCLGLIKSWYAFYTIPIIFLMTCCFSALGLFITSHANSYDFFTYYMTLVINPMMFLSGVFYPLHTLPAGLQYFIKILPLYHGVVLIRPLLLGKNPEFIALHIFILLFYAILFFYLALYKARKKMID